MHRVNNTVIVTLKSKCNKRQFCNLAKIIYKKNRLRTEYKLYKGKQNDDVASTSFSTSQ